MTTQATDLRLARKHKGWNQAELARRLGVSQGYVSLLESGDRPVPMHLASTLVRLLELSPTHLPVETPAAPLKSDRALSALGALGYAGFAHRGKRVRLNPADLVARALRQDHVEARLVEALPWVLLRFPDLDWPWLVSQAKQHDVQNRLGFVVTLARRLADRQGQSSVAESLRSWELVLERSRLQREDAFAGDALTNAERKWLRSHRSADAAHWNMLSGLSADVLAHE